MMGGRKDRVKGWQKRWEGRAEGRGRRKEARSRRVDRADARQG